MVTVPHLQGKKSIFVLMDAGLPAIVGEAKLPMWPQENTLPARDLTRLLRVAATVNPHLETYSPLSYQADRYRQLPASL
jgi:hypothetical protein